MLSSLGGDHDNCIESEDGCTFNDNGGPATCCSSLSSSGVSTLTHSEYGPDPF